MDQNSGENSQNAWESNSSSGGGVTQKAIVTIQVAIDQNIQTLFKASKAHRVTFEFITDQFFCKCGKVLTDKKPVKRLVDEATVSIFLLLAY